MRQTLQINRPDIGRLVWATLFLALFTCAGELVLRVDAIASRLGAPSIGSDHRQLEEQWFRLQQFVEEHGSVDCVFLGDSTVMSDFSPIAFAQAYSTQSGDALTCYNFGVGAVSVAGTATLAILLQEVYEPRLFIIGLEPLNFTVPQEEQGSADLTSVPWVRYRLAAFNLQGWAYEHLRLAGYMETIGRILRLALHESGISLPGAEGAVEFVAGYYPVQGRGPFDITQPPDPSVNHPYLEHYFAAHATYEMLPENLEALNQILALNGPGTEIVLVEMPLTTTFDHFFGRGAEDHEYFVHILSEKAAQHGVPFFRMDDSGLIPAAGWYNYNHLNAEGAPIFSEWLGRQLGTRLLAKHH
jgi:hypothetical protein